MDPDKALETIRESLAVLRIPEDHVGVIERDEALGDLVESMGALDEWLSRGGFLPADWQRKPMVPTEEEAFAAGVRGEHPAHFAARVADALTREYAELQKRILRSLDRTSSGVAILMDEENHGACTQLEELGLVAKGESAITESGDWTNYSITEAGRALVEAWRAR